MSQKSVNVKMAVTFLLQLFLSHVIWHLALLWLGLSDHWLLRLLWRGLLKLLGDDWDLTHQNGLAPWAIHIGHSHTG